MSAAVGAISATKDVSFNPQMEEEELIKNNKNSKSTGAEPSHEFPHTDGGHEDDDDDDEKEEEHVTKLIKSEKELDLGPQISLKEQLEKDKV
jgi:Rho GDP-dissociation inhibitor